MTHSRNVLFLKLAVVFISLAPIYFLTGCTSPSGPGNGSTMVHMVASFSKAGTMGFAKQMATLGVDSLRIDSAIVVISRIKFLADHDSEKADTGGDDHEWHEGDAITDGGDHEGDEGDTSVVFKGPFVIHVHDTVAINFADKMLPAGTYNAIQFKIHRLISGEQHEDSDERSGHGCWPDSGLAGASITVWGAVHKDSGWKPFTFAMNDELTFRIKGNFDVPASTSSVRIALNINMNDWFRNPVDGTLLDPTNTSFDNRLMIRRAIERAFGHCRGGHDWGDDGHPDD